jgi:hypothetical protein
MKLVVLMSLALLSAGAGAVSAEQAPLERTQKLGAWTVSDLGAKPGDDSEREVRLAGGIENVDFTLHRSDPDGAGITIRFSRCEGLNWNSGFSLEGAVPARVTQLKAEIHDAFKDFAKACPVKAGEEAALLAGFDAAAALAETWIHDRPFTYPPEPADPK